LAVLLAKLTLSEQRMNLIQQVEENCQQKILAAQLLCRDGFAYHRQWCQAPVRPTR
jgi:hypothetical protein